MGQWAGVVKMRSDVSYTAGDSYVGKGTNIQYADDTVNPSSGCDGCPLWCEVRKSCYAGNVHESRLSKSLPQLYDKNFNNVRLIPGRMAKAASSKNLSGLDRPHKWWLNGHRRIIFIGDMGDIYSKAVPFEYLKTEVIDNVCSVKGRRHVWLMLTKQPGRMSQFAQYLQQQGMEWPDNLWAGTSIMSRSTIANIDTLRGVPAKCRFLSLEPLLEDVCLQADDLQGIHWVILGGESEQPRERARPCHLEWFRHCISVAVQCSVAVFVKQLGYRPYENGKLLRLSDEHGGRWREWPKDLLIRELPIVA